VNCISIMSADLFVPDEPTPSDLRACVYVVTSSGRSLSLSDWHQLRLLRDSEIVLGCTMSAEIFRTDWHLIR
jgi:hypothetical protein